MAANPQFFIVSHQFHASDVRHHLETDACVLAGIGCADTVNSNPPGFIALAR
jgi:hypothetical protein